MRTKVMILERCPCTLSGPCFACRYLENKNSENTVWLTAIGLVILINVDVYKQTNKCLFEYT